MWKVFILLSWLWRTVIGLRLTTFNFWKPIMSLLRQVGLWLFFFHWITITKLLDYADFLICLLQTRVLYIVSVNLILSTLDLWVGFDFVGANFFPCNSGMCWIFFFLVVGQVDIGVKCWMFHVLAGFVICKSNSEILNFSTAATKKVLNILSGKNWMLEH